MDYRNADGSLAEMCGNGARLFARYLVDEGLEELGQFCIATRGGLKAVVVSQERVTVDMGPCTHWSRPRSTSRSTGGSTGGSRCRWATPTSSSRWPTWPTQATCAPLPLVQPSSAFPTGVNVEFVLGRGPGRIAMRVFERGVGETRSCGTGACAAAVAAAHWWAAERLDYQVEVPGGVLRVRRSPTGSILLSGPTAFVASGFIDHNLWRGPEALDIALAAIEACPSERAGQCKVPPSRTLRRFVPTAPRPYGMTAEPARRWADR